MHARQEKITVLGPSNAGKTALVSKAASGHYSEAYRADIGANCLPINIERVNEKVKLLAWDFAGDPRFHSLMNFYLTNVNFVVVCCDVINDNPQAVLEFYINAIRKINADLPIFIALTKADLIDGKTDHMPLVNDLISKNNNCHFFGMVSVKDQTQEHLWGLFQKALSKKVMDVFFKTYDRLKASEWTPEIFRRTNVDKKEANFSSLLDNARHKKSATTNKAFLDLGWLKKDKTVSDTAPQELKDADASLRCTK